MSHNKDSLLDFIKQEAKFAEDLLPGDVVVNGTDILKIEKVIYDKENGEVDIEFCNDKSTEINNYQEDEIVFIIPRSSLKDAPKNHSKRELKKYKLANKEY
jgi:hypothetical protein